MGHLGAAGGISQAVANATYGTVVVHGATASTARPAGAVSVTWIGSVEPTNMTEADMWIGPA